MATLRTNLLNTTYEGSLPRPANTDTPDPLLTSDQKIIAWLFRVRNKERGSLSVTDVRQANRYVGSGDEKNSETADDWNIVTNLCGHPAEDFHVAGVDLPLTAAEIDHFRRNHRERDPLVGRDFFAAKTDLPSPLAELYSLYCHRARLDTEAALFVAQTTGSPRIARTMGDLLAIGGFANGHECVSHLTMTYSVPASFDTSDLIDRANHEAARRLNLPVDHPAHLLKMSPDEIGLLATDIVERNALNASDFLDKANLLAEARQDVARLPIHEQFATAVHEGDLPIQHLWVARICAAYSHIFGQWATGLSEDSTGAPPHADEKF